MPTQPLISPLKPRWIIMSLFHLTKSHLTHHPSVRIFQPREATFSRLPGALLTSVPLVEQMSILSSSLYLQTWRKDIGGHVRVDQAYRRAAEDHK
jgi:hypothetical protein